VFVRDKGNVVSALADLTAALTKHASVADKVGNEVAAKTGWSYMGVDPTPAPLGDVSIGAAIEAFTGARFGSSGTLTAARIITAAVKAVPVKQVGYSGLMVPVMGQTFGTTLGRVHVQHRLPARVLFRMRYRPRYDPTPWQYRRRSNRAYPR
jgi:Uncharacterised ACR (DUF711)